MASVNIGTKELIGRIAVISDTLASIALDIKRAEGEEKMQLFLAEGEEFLKTSGFADLPNNGGRYLIVRACHTLAAFCHVKQFGQARVKVGLDRIAFLVKETKPEDYEEVLEELWQEFHENEL